MEGDDCFIHGCIFVIECVGYSFQNVSFFSFIGFGLVILDF